MKLQLKAGTTSQIVSIFIQNSSLTTGAGLTGLAYDTASLVAYFHREDDGDAGGTAISLATATRGTWATGGFKEKDATNMPGVYELSLPDAVLAASSKWAVVMLKGAANMAPVLLEIELTATDLHDVGLGIKLDKLLYNTSTYASDVTADSVLDTIANTSANGGTFNRESRSLDAIANGGASIEDIADGQHDVLQVTTITVNDQTHFVLATGSTDDDAYNNMLVVLEDVSTAVQKAVGTVDDYVGSTKTVTLSATPAFTIATTDKVRILAVGSTSSGATATEVWTRAGTDPSAVPGPTATLEAKVNWICARLLNQLSETATTQTLRNNAGDGDIGSAATSDDGTTAVRGKYS